MGCRALVVGNGGAGGPQKFIRKRDKGEASKNDVFISSKHDKGEASKGDVFALVVNTIKARPPKTTFSISSTSVVFGHQEN